MITATEQLRQLDEQFFDAMHSTDPLTATMLGVEGYDSRLPDPSPEGVERSAARFRKIEERLSQLSPDHLSAEDRIDREVMAELAWSLRVNLEDGLWAANASAAGYVSPQAIAFQAIPTAPLRTRVAVGWYLERLAQLPAYMDAVLLRYRQSMAAGRHPTKVGVQQAMAQLDGHLGRPLVEDRLLVALRASPVAESHDLARAAEVVEYQVRPALARLRDGLAQELLSGARPEAEVGLCFIPGGEDAYRRAVRRHTTTELEPAEIHKIGRDVLSALEQEWEEVGGRVFGRSSPADVRRRLREDPRLRFHSSGEIVEVVRAALGRAEQARDGFFPRLEIADCVVEEIDPVEAGNSALAYYRGPSQDGGRAGAHCVLTTDPTSRFTYEYEALAFHESSPGHHLQIASAQRLEGLPRYRRHLDAEVCAYVEGWGLYAERLADEMGLYTSDLQRLGMLSFDALRACRLVVDTGMHHLGWSRQEAVDFMWQNTATTTANVDNEVNRYIAWPGQALAYMVGRREIRRLRREAEADLGPLFDLRGFHGAVLSQGAVPLRVLAGVVERWRSSVARGGNASGEQPA